MVVSEFFMVNVIVDLIDLRQERQIIFSINPERASNKKAALIL